MNSSNLTGIWVSHPWRINDKKPWKFQWLVTSEVFPILKCRSLFFGGHSEPFCGGFLTQPICKHLSNTFQDISCSSISIVFLCVSTVTETCVWPCRSSKLLSRTWVDTDVTKKHVLLSLLMAEEKWDENKNPRILSKVFFFPPLLSWNVLSKCNFWVVTRKLPALHRESLLSSHTLCPRTPNMTPLWPGILCAVAR